MLNLGPPERGLEALHIFGTAHRLMACRVWSIRCSNNIARF